MKDTKAPLRKSWGPSLLDPHTTADGIAWTRMRLTIEEEWTEMEEMTRSLRMKWRTTL